MKRVMKPACREPHLRYSVMKPISAISGACAPRRVCAQLRERDVAEELHDARGSARRGRRAAGPRARDADRNERPTHPGKHVLHLRGPAGQRRTPVDRHDHVAGLELRC